MRFISMKHFRSPEAIKRCVFNNETLVLGQILGSVKSFGVKENTDTNGVITTSMVLYGDFSGVCYEQQAKLQAAGKPAAEAEFNAEALYMPKWYTDQVVARLQAQGAGGVGIDFAAEIIVSPVENPASAIKYAYDVKSLIARPADSAIERMKRALASKGVLRLAPPASANPADLRLSQQHHDAPETEEEALSDNEPNVAGDDDGDLASEADLAPGNTKPAKAKAAAHKAA